MKFASFVKAFFLVFLMTASSVYATVSTGDSLDLKPQTYLKTVETKHFEIQIPSHLMPHAKTVSAYLESAFNLLSKFLRWTPKHKIYVYLVDNTDSANGVTLFPFRRGMVLYLTPPDSWNTTTFYDDWLWMLIVHELTHYLNVDPTEGISEVLRVIFGDVVRFNATWPDWMLEGLAVYLETKFTKGGRGRSSYYRMLSRAAVDAGVFNTTDFSKFDQIVGENSWFPGGQRPYFFGYNLMNQVVTDEINQGRTATEDSKNKIKQTDDLLGVMSIRSASRVPFLVSSHLDKMTDRGWSYYWDEWIKKRTFSANNELKKIQSQKVSKPDWITSNGDYTLGHALSEDGQWLAYNEVTINKIAGLYLKNLKTGKTKRIADKTQGVGLSFDPIGRFLFFSEIIRHKQYNTFYDLNYYDVKTKKVHRLTRGYRAQDPHVSPIGDYITFVQRKSGGSRLMVAKLKTTKSGRVKVYAPEVYFKPKGTYDHVANPKFSADGESIFFSLHRNGKAQKDILSVGLPTKKTVTWVKNGFMNRFPIHGPDRKLYFVSDMTGVDNLFQVSKPNTKAKQVTNVKTGIWLPGFHPKKKNQILASYFTYKGWDLASLDINIKGFRKIKTSPTPKIPYAKPTTPKESVESETSNYSPFGSLAPRDWRPTFSFSFVRPIIGFQLGGFDSAFRNEYELYGAYDFLTKSSDVEVAYYNRSLGPTLSLAATYYTPASSVIVNSSGTLISHTRRPLVSLGLSFPFKFQYSTLLASLSASIQRDFSFIGSSDTPFSISPTVPLIASSITYSGELASSYAITQERGPYLNLTGAAYVLPEAVNWKVLGRYIDYWRVSDHAVFVPSIAGTWVNRESTEYTSANVIFTGDLGTSLVLDSFRNLQNLSEMTIRGYPTLTLSRKTAVVASMDFRFPVLRFYRGMGTGPYFFKDLIAFFYGEAGYLPGRPFLNVSLFPSVGGGLKLTTKMFNLPMTFGGEIQQGLDTTVGGATQFVMSFRVNASNF